MIPRLRNLALVIIAASSLGACTTIELISKYDEPTDSGATALQREISEFTQRIGNAQTDEERSFASNQPFYQQAAVDIDALQVRAQAIYKNRITIEQLQLVEDNLAYLALLHKGCVTAPLTDAQKRAVADKGIDASVDCRVAYGATVEVKNRGSSRLNPLLVPIIKSQLDQQLGAVIALELAKKRGDKEGTK